MNIHNSAIKGVQDIRTVTRASSQTRLPHEAYLRISCLEMEKARRGQERLSALKRVRAIEDRFSEIEAEKAAILLALGQDGASAIRSGRSLGGPKRSSLNRPAHKGFRFRY